MPIVKEFKSWRCECGAAATRKIVCAERLTLYNCDLCAADFASSLRTLPSDPNVALVDANAVRDQGELEVEMSGMPLCLCGKRLVLGGFTRILSAHHVMFGMCYACMDATRTSIMGDLPQ